MIDSAMGITVHPVALDRSRLGCQIDRQAAPDGLVLHLPERQY